MDGQVSGQDLDYAKLYDDGDMTEDQIRKIYGLQYLDKFVKALRIHRIMKTYWKRFMLATSITELKQAEANIEAALKDVRQDISYVQREQSFQKEIAGRPVWYDNNTRVFYENDITGNRVVITGSGEKYRGGFKNWKVQVQDRTRYVSYNKLDFSQVEKTIQEDLKMADNVLQTKLDVSLEKQKILTDKINNLQERYSRITALWYIQLITDSLASITKACAMLS